jgi:hypothetical protein
MNRYPLHYLGSKRDYSHLFLLSKFPGYRTKYTGSLGISVVVDDDCGVVIEANIRTVLAADLFYSF